MIKGISDKRRLPRLGKIRLGEKARSSSGKEYPKALDYFNCPEPVQAVYGDEPRQLDIMFPVDDPETIFPQWLKRYGKSKGLVCIGDGDTATEFDSETGEGHEVECPYEECEAYQKKHCRRVASLQFMLPKVPGFGVWQIDTTSYHSIVNLNSCFDMIRGICGRVSMVPLILRLEPKEVKANGSKKVVHVLNLTSPLSLEQMVERARQELPQLEAPKPSHEQPTDLYAKAAPVEGKDAEPEHDDPVPLLLAAASEDEDIKRLIAKLDAYGCPVENAASQVQHLLPASEDNYDQIERELAIMLARLPEPENEELAEIKARPNPKLKRSLF